MRKSFTLLGVVLLLSIVVSSCKKDDTNPVVIDPNTSTVQILNFTVYEFQWVGDQNGYEFTLTIPEINQNVVSNGCVIVYTEDEYYVNHWIQLPITLCYGSYNSVWLYEWALNSVWLGTYDDDGATIRPSTLNFRVVVFQTITQSQLEKEVDINN